MADPTKILLKTARFNVEQVTWDSARGKVSRAVIRHPGAVAIVPCVDNDHVCLIRNYRMSVDRELLELPAGTLEVGEDPQLAAFRELQEETGYVAESVELLQEFYLSPGILDERMYLYIARELVAGPPARELGEEMENVVVSWSEARELVRTGKIEDAKTIIGLSQAAPT